MAVREPHSSGRAARAGTDTTSPDAPRKRRRWIAAIVLVAAAAIAVYVNTFGAELTLDDVFIIEKDRLVTRWADVPKVFASAYWVWPGEDVPDSSKGNLYRPFAVLTYAAQFAVHGVRPAGYHVVNVLLHALASVLLLLLVRAILDDARVAFAAALLFAVHPIHTEAVSNVVGRAEVLALVGTLACALFFARALGHAEQGRRRATAAWVAASVGAYAVGCFSKETGVVAPAVILAWEAFVPARRALLRLRLWAIAAFACYSGVLASYLALRSRSAPSVEMHAGFVGVDTLHRVATALRVCLEYVGLLVAPVRLSADYWTDDVPVARGLGDPGVAAALIVLALACALVAWSGRRLPGVGWGLASFALALLPVSNLLFPIGVLKAERILYTPSAGFLIAATSLLPLAWSRPRLRTAAWALVGVLALAYAVRTVVRNRDWHDNRTLALATLAHSPNAPVFHGILGRWYREHGQNPEAREHLIRVAELLPNNWLSLYHVGNIELDMGLPAEAVEHYRRGLALDPKKPFILHNLSQALMQLHRDDEAMDTLERLVELKPSDQDAWQNLLSLYVSTGQLTRGEKRADEAVRLYPDAVPVLWNAGVLYERLGRADDARRLFARAHELDPKLK